MASHWRMSVDAAKFNSKFTIKTIFAGSTSKPYLHTICPNNIPKGVPKMHFLMFNEI
jgi:hypothetical protein